jgi:hypothetical protein
MPQLTQCGCHARDLRSVLCTPSAIIQSLDVSAQALPSFSAVSSAKMTLVRLPTPDFPHKLLDLAPQCGRLWLHENIAGCTITGLRDGHHCGLQWPSQSIQGRWELNRALPAPSKTDPRSSPVARAPGGG